MSTYKINDLQLGDYLVIEAEDASSKFGPTYKLKAIYVKDKVQVQFWSNKFINDYKTKEKPSEFQLTVINSDNKKSVKINGYEPIVNKTVFSTNSELRSKLGL